MENETPVVDATVIAEAEKVANAPVANASLEALDAQKLNFQAQLEQAKADMTKLQQQFESIKTKAVKLEGALESLALLRASLTK